MSADARVDAIFIAGGAAQPMRAVDAAEALPGRGLAGDRYDLGTGRYSHKPGPDRHLTLIAGEALDELAGSGVVLAPGEHRRNVVTRGVDVAALVGRGFAIGDVRLRGVRPCHPCAYLEQVTGRPGLRDAIGDRGGLRTEIVTGGVIRVGDPVLLLDEP